MYIPRFISALSNTSIMAAAFHWVKVKAVCYATEDEDRIHDTMVQLIGTDDEEVFDIDISEGLHGNPITVIDANLTHNKECERIFRNLGADVLTGILDGIEDRIDEDDTFYLRIDKQKAVQGIYEISHSGDVISITGKVAAHPAKKEIAIKVMREFIQRLIPEHVPSQ